MNFLVFGLFIALIAASGWIYTLHIRMEINERRIRDLEKAQITFYDTLMRNI